MAGELRVLLGDQLCETVSSLRDLVTHEDAVLMAEVIAEARYVARRKQKLVMVFAAMRCFANGLARRGIRVCYVKLDRAGNSQSIDGKIRRALVETGCRRVVVTEPGEWRLIDLVRRLAHQLAEDRAGKL
jgi:deoxyribodipyrimidine photolyase-related protein